MPPFFQFETGFFQPCLPDMRPIGMLDARDTPEPFGIPFPQKMRERKFGEVSFVRHTKIERGVRPQAAGNVGQHRLNMRDMFQDGIAERAGESTVRERASGAIRLD